MGVPANFLSALDQSQFEILGTTLSQHNQFIKPTKKYTNVLQHKANGTTCNGSKLNTVSTLLVQDKPEKYYTADGVEGYLIAVYARLIIKRKEMNYVEKIESLLEDLKNKKISKQECGIAAEQAIMENKEDLSMGELLAVEEELNKAGTSMYEEVFVEKYKEK